MAWYALGLAGCASPILYSTVNTILKDDAEERALVVVSSNGTDGCLQALADQHGSFRGGVVAAGHASWQLKHLSGYPKS